MLSFKSLNSAFTRGCKVRGEAESEQKQQICSSQNAQEKLQWRNVSVLADVMPLGLLKLYQCLTTALSSESSLEGMHPARCQVLYMSQIFWGAWSRWYLQVFASEMF